jgi:hypothetical protein
MEFSADEMCINPLPNRSVTLVYTIKLLKKFERRFKDFEPMKFTVSFITNSFQERDISET